MTASLFGEQTWIGVFAVAQGYLQPGLQSSTEQWGLLLAKPGATVHGCWVTASLFGEQMSIGVFAVAQGCCQPGLQSSTEQRGMLLARYSAAVHWCWVAASLLGGKMSIGLFAVSQGCCQPGLQSSRRECFLPDLMLQCIVVAVLAECIPHCSVLLCRSRSVSLQIQI